MSGETRQQKIERALSFIRSPLPYPDPEGYEGFVVTLVCDLLEEGNASFAAGQSSQACRHFSEGVSVALYGRDEELDVPTALLESLYINRAAAHHSMGEFDSAVQDCDLALGVCDSNAKALYRKAVCLKESGRLKEALDCSSACLRVSPQDQTVISLSQEISTRLGLKHRKTFIASERGSAAGSEDVPPPLDQMPTFRLVEVTGPVADSGRASPVLKPPVPVSESHEDLMGDELDLLLDSVSQEEQSGIVPLLSFPSSSSPRLPPAFFSSVGGHLNVLDSFTKPEPISDSPVNPLDSLDSICPSVYPAVCLQRPLVSGGDTLDSLSEFTLPGEKVCPSFLPSVKLTNSSHMRNGHMKSTLSRLSQNPLEKTHEFTQACSSCFISTGPGVLDFELRPDVSHSCRRDVVLCRTRGAAHSLWRRIRPRPRNSFTAAFVLCREVLENQVCKYGEACTFAYCQEEIDVWTQERRGLLIRELLFSPSTNQRPALGVAELLNIHTGMFMFLCEVCFDCKPRKISKRWKENPALCANVLTRHPFDRHKCLVHAAKSSSSAVVYSKIRSPVSGCDLRVCPDLSRGCEMEDKCCFAHSLIELHIWSLQRDTGISHEDIVQESKKHWNKQRPAVVAPHSPKKIPAAKVKSPVRAEAGPVQGTGSAEATEVKGRRLELVLKFVCGQCWRDGLLSEADRNMKYCSAKARHSWTKDRRVLLVKSPERKKWVSVRPLPFAKTFPQQYDICIHVLKQRKCHYLGNCSFAHSQEEKELWTYMKNNNFMDVQQVFDEQLSTNQNRASDGTSPPQPIEEKQITMPTDFAELVRDALYCPLCGKHSNSERQWQQHVSSDRHIQRVLSGEGEDESLAWSHRFPGCCFSICPRLALPCSEGVSCDFAHSDEELQEWCERRDFLRRRVEKAKAELLLLPTEDNFGNYNFLLQD